MQALNHCKSLLVMSCTPKSGSCTQLKDNSILVEPDIPIYDLRQVLQQVGLPLEPQAPLFDQLQVCLQHDKNRLYATHNMCTSFLSCRHPKGT